MAKDKFLQIRVSKDERERMEQVANDDKRDLSSWARIVLMDTVEKWEARRQKLRVAERPRVPFEGRVKPDKK
ncbi:MAG TPA: hypothetical protein VE967_02835 [Gemmatimonadaceae bacterium]|nr:hypothetical protein [Gemmatimonadaceae bacterium]